MDLHLSISNGFVSSKIYDKRDDFDFDIVNFPFVDGDVSQLIRFARVSSHVTDFNAHNKILPVNLSIRAIGIINFEKAFSKFYRRHYEFVPKFKVGLKSLLQQGLSEPEFYGDLVYKLRKNVSRADFSDQFRKVIMRYKRIRCNINVMRQSACLVINPITVDSFASLFNCMPVGRASDSMMLIDLFKLVGTGLSLVCCLVIRGSAGGFLLHRYFSGIISHPGVLRVSQHVSIESSSLTHHRPYS